MVTVRARLLSVLFLLSILPASFVRGADGPDRAERLRKLETQLRKAPIPEAIQALEAAIAEAPDDSSTRMQRMEIVLRLRSEKRFEEAAVEGEKLLDDTMSHAGDRDRLSTLPNASIVLSMIYETMGQEQKGRAALDRPMAWLNEVTVPASSPDLKRARHRQLANVAGWIAKRDGFAAGDDLLSGEQRVLEADRETWAPSSETLRQWGQLVESRISLADRSDQPEVVQSLSAELDAAAEEMLKQNPDSDLAVIMLLEVRTNSVGRLFRDEPEAALALVKKTLEQTALKSELHGQIIDRARERLTGYEPRIQAALIAKSLTGRPAPEIKGAAWVNGDARPPETLQGKVVLVDFWALWCGPCIAAFPEVTALHEEFHGRGLEIVGVTRCYGFEWDEAGDEPVFKEHKDLTKETDAVGRYMKKKALPFPSIVDERESPMFTNYGVTGIPQSVLIDRKGVIRLLQVGHTEAHTKALRDKIVELLAE